MALDPSSAFAFPDYRRLLLARVATMVALQVQGVAVAWHVVSRTGRALDLGWVGLAQFLPAAGLSLLAGHVADRYDRRAILRVTYAAFGVLALLLFAYARTGASSNVPIYGLLLLVGTTRAFAQPAGSALAPELVPPAVFSNAVAWSSSFWQMSSIIGPAIGGVLTAALADFVYLVSAALCAVSYVVIRRVETVPTRMRETRISRDTLFAGVRYVWTKKLLLGSISLDLFAVLLGGAVALLPLYAKEFGADAAGLGVLRAAPGVGAALMAGLFAWRPLKRNAGFWMFLCVFVFGLATIGFSYAHGIALTMALLFVTGAADMVSVVVRQTLLQKETPPEMRGRVSAVNSVFVGASNELGEFESGVTASLLGYRTATLVGGVGTCAVVVLWALAFPDLRRADRLELHA